MSDLKIEAVQQAKMATPPIAINVATTVGGFSLNDWVMLATLAYIGLQAGWLVWKWWKAARTKGWTPNNE